MRSLNPAGARIRVLGLSDLGLLFPDWTFYFLRENRTRVKVDLNSAIKLLQHRSSSLPVPSRVQLFLIYIALLHRRGRRRRDVLPVLPDLLSRDPIWRIPVRRTQSFCARAFPVSSSCLFLALSCLHVG